MERLDSLAGSRSSHSPPEVKGYFDFYLGPGSAVELSPGDLSNKDLRIAGNVRVLNLITAGLAQKGIRTDQPYVNKFGIATRCAHFPNCTVSLSLGAGSRETVPHFEMLTFILKPRTEIPSSAFDEWRGLCDRIEEILTTELKVTSLQRLAKK